MRVSRTESLEIPIHVALRSGVRGLNDNLRPVLSECLLADAKQKLEPHTAPTRDTRP